MKHNGKRGRKRPRGLRTRPKGRSVDPQALREVQTLLADVPRRRDLLIEHLHLIQDHYGHLSAAHLVALAHEMQLAPVEVYEVASFYHHFDVVKEGETPPPTITVRVCDSVSCELAGAEQLIPALEQEMGKTVRVQRVPCVGRCETAPVAVVGQNPIGTASLEQVRHAVEHQATQASLPAGTVDYQAYRAGGGYQVLRECLNGSRDLDSVLGALEDSGLRGLGGAGFPAGRKWRIVRGYAGPRLLAVNIDEGEPGTFKDRYYLERDPHRFLEGMLIAAWAAEINTVYIYIRDEYPACLQLLKNAHCCPGDRLRQWRSPLSTSGVGRVRISVAKSRA